MPSENVKVTLRSKILVWIRVVHAFRKQVVDQTDSEQIEVTDADAQLDTPKQEQRRFVLVY